MADRLAEDGFLDAGYKYITVDDCWPEHQRDGKGRLQPDHQRFPNGIKALTNYVRYFPWMSNVARHVGPRYESYAERNKYM